MIAALNTDGGYLMRGNFYDFKKSLKDKKIAVLGIGISNRPLIKYIASLGAHVTACDKISREKLGEISAELENLGVKLQLGHDYLNELENFDIIFRTPSLRPDYPELIRAVKNGACMTSEIEEFIKYCPGDIVGVTGSDGKTTTTTLIYNILRKQGYNTWLGGNIGVPLFDKLDSMKTGDKIVLELSSFQLMTACISPDISVITNLSPNHLDIHKSMEEYVESKKNIYKYQGEKGMLVLNLDNELTRGMEMEARGEVSFFSRRQKVRKGAYLDGNELMLVKDSGEYKICSADEIKLPGLHNIENLLAAFAAASSWCDIDSMRDVALTFAGVEHRIEFVRELNGVRYYNGSIASSPTRTIADLNSFNQKVILIAGGSDKKIPFDELARVGVQKVKHLILVGATARKIEDAFIHEMKSTGIYLPVTLASDLEEAVKTAAENGERGDVVTLSPACASFDMFKNFEERGNRFKEIVNSL